MRIVPPLTAAEVIDELEGVDSKDLGAFAVWSTMVKRRDSISPPQSRVAEKWEKAGGVGRWPRVIGAIVPLRGTKFGDQWASFVHGGWSASI